MTKMTTEEIIKAREVIKKKDIKPNLDEIRSFRNDVLNGDIEKLNQITYSQRFFHFQYCDGFYVVLSLICFMVLSSYFI